MTADRTCLSCDRPVRATMTIPVRGVKNAFFCGDHYQLGKHAFFCHPCAGQLTKLGVPAPKPAPESN